MIPSKIVSYARLQTNTSTDLISDIDAYVYLNLVINDFWKDMCNDTVGDSLTSWTYNTTANTAGYTLPVSVAATTVVWSTFGINQLVKIGIKYNSSDTYYTPVELVYVESFLNLPDFNAAEQSEANPVALTDWTTLTIYPTPDTSVTNGLKLWWPKDHYELGTTGSTVVTEDVEWSILIPSKWHHVIIEWLKYRFYGVRGVEFESLKFQAKQNYENEKNRAINQMWDAGQHSSSGFDANLEYYE